MQTPHPRFDRIVSDPDLLGGQPCIRGHRLTIKRVLLILSQYEGDFSELNQDYDLEAEDIRQALAYAAEGVDDLALFARQAS